MHIFHTYIHLWKIKKQKNKQINNKQKQSNKSLKETFNLSMVQKKEGEEHVDQLENKAQSNQQKCYFLAVTSF